MYSFSYLEPVCCSMSSSNCCFLTCIQIPQEAGQLVWYSHLFQNFQQFIMIHTVKGFGTVNKTEIDVFLELLLFRWSKEELGGTEDPGGLQPMGSQRVGHHWATSLHFSMCLIGVPEIVNREKFWRKKYWEIMNDSLRNKEPLIEWVHQVFTSQVEWEW